ncbi:MAG: hypothetical protein JSV81_22810, partial [Anaerolineales bacterium]
MNKEPRFSRRKLLIGAAAALGGSLLGRTRRWLGMPGALAQDSMPYRIYLPIIVAPAKPRVVHVRDAGATNWNGVDSFYEAVGQAVVDSMVQTGLQLLTSQSSWADIWGTLFGRVHPEGYSAGQKIALKVNLNASLDYCATHGNLIDALPQPILALISGMIAAGVQPGDVTVYDSIRVIPSYLRDPIWMVYPGVKFVGTGSCPGVIPPGHGADSSLRVSFSEPYGYLKDRQLADVLY